MGMTQSSINDFLIKIDFLHCLEVSSIITHSYKVICLLAKSIRDISSALFRVKVHSFYKLCEKYTRAMTVFTVLSPSFSQSLENFHVFALHSCFHKARVWLMDGVSGMVQSWNARVSEFLWLCYYSEQPSMLQHSLILLDSTINVVKQDLLFL